MFSSTELQLNPYTDTYWPKWRWTTKIVPPLGWWWPTYKSQVSFLKIITLPSGCAVLLSLGLCSSVWDSSPRADCSYFWSSLLMMGQNCSKLAEHPILFPVKLKETLPGFSPLRSGGDPARCLLLMQSAQLHWLMEQARSKFCGRIHPGKSVGFRASRDHCEFQNGFKQQLGVKLSVCDISVVTGVPSTDPHPSASLWALCTKHPLTPQMSSSPSAVGLGMPKGIHLDDTAHCTHATIPSLTLTMQTYINHNQV